MTRLRTERGLDRLVNFSDATVAIAITVLLLPLVDIALEIEKLSLGDLLAANLGTIIAFAITFAVIARLWFSHHRLFEAAVDYDSGMIWVNFLWLASIVVMPFTANVLAHSDAADPGVNALYIGTVLSSSVALLWLVLHLRRRHPELTSTGAAELLHFQDSVLTVIAFAVALVLSVLFPEVGMFWLLLLIPANVVGGLLRRRAASAGATPSS